MTKAWRKAKSSSTLQMPKGKGKRRKKTKRPFG